MLEGTVQRSVHGSEGTRTQEHPRNELGWFRTSLTTPVLAAVDTARGARLRGGATSSPAGGSPQPHLCWACGVGAGDGPELQRLRLNGWRLPKPRQPAAPRRLQSSSGQQREGPLSPHPSSGKGFHPLGGGGGDSTPPAQGVLGSPRRPLPSSEFAPWV